MGKKYTLTILGLGNILLRDEGFGVHFIQQLEKKYRFPENIAVIDGGTLGYTLMEIVCQTERLLVIDTVKANDKPGTIYRFHPEAIPAHLDYSVSAHEVEFMDVLVKAEMMGDHPKTTIIAVLPEDIKGVGLDLTETLQKSLPKVEDLVLEEIEKLDVRIHSL